MKKICSFLIALIASMAFIGNVNAATAKFSVTSSSGQVIVGNSVTVYVTVSSTLGLGSWEYNLNYDKNVFKLKSSDVGLHYAAVANNSNTKSVVYKYVFTALKSGTGKFYVDSSSAISFVSEDVMSVSNGSKSVSVISYADYQASLSTNNYLKGIFIEGATITPEFSKDVTEYLVQVSEDTKEIKISATKEDASATVNGTGTFEVSPGNNAFEIVVVAQNGSERTYKLNVEVLDKNPITVNVDNEEYTVVKIASNLKSPESYTETTVKINNFDIPAFYSDITKFTLVGLKDKNGDISLYIYENGDYEKYVELIYGNLTIYPLEMNKSVENFEKTKIAIQNNEIEVLQSKLNSRYYLIRGLNVETKEEGLYIYDSKDDTLMMFDKDSFDHLMKQNKTLLLVVLVFGVATFGFFIIILCMLHKNKKLKKTIKEMKKEAKPEKKTRKKSEKIESDEIK